VNSPQTQPHQRSAAAPSTDALTEQLVEFRIEARRWLEHQEIPHIPPDLGERLRIQRDWQRRLFDSGWLALSWPKEFGGRGLTRVHDVIFSQERVRVRAPRPIGVIGIEVIGPTILRFGTDDQRLNRLPRMLAAEDVWCQGFSEPGAGSDLASLSTRADRDGDDFVINGHKVWTTVVTEANWCGLLARTNQDVPKHHGISFFLVDLSQPGITSRPLPQMLGEAEFGELHFEDVVVPASSLVGDLNDGWRCALQTLSAERSSIILSRLAEIQVAFGDCVEVLAANPPEDETVSKLGEVAASLYALESQSQQTMQRLVAGETEPSRFDSADKLATSLTEQLVSQFVYEQLGAYASVRGENPRGLSSSKWINHYVMSRAQTLMGGTSQIQRNTIAERTLGLPREPR
jgi:alkylation response protein AidB-like acyl-CoA dehydrogenase